MPQCGIVRLPMGAGPLYSGRGRRRVLRAAPQAVGGRISPLPGSQSPGQPVRAVCAEPHRRVRIHATCCRTPHAEALDALGGLEAGGSAGEVAVEPPGGPPHLRSADGAQPSPSAPPSPPEPICPVPAYPPPTGPAWGREYSSDEDGDGHRSTSCWRVEILRL